jgi:hypothetical protein
LAKGGQAVSIEQDVGTNLNSGNVEAIAATAAALRAQADRIAKEAAALNEVTGSSLENAQMPKTPSTNADGLENVSIPDVALSKEEINDLIMETWHKSGNRGSAPKMQ